MTEYIVGAVAGSLCTAVIYEICRYRAQKKRVIAQEKEYAALQQHVDKAVSSIERIIHGGE
jgi:hypothetical protein